MRALVVLALLMMLALPAATAADVYRCVTGNGVVRYAEKPCKDGKAEKLKIENRRTDPAIAAEQAKQRSEQLAAIEKAETESAKAAEEAADQAAERARQCTAARERLQRLVNARRVTEGEGENRKYLESDEVLARRQSAQDQVNEFCGD